MFLLKNIISYGKIKLKKQLNQNKEKIVYNLFKKIVKKFILGSNIQY